MKKVLYTISSFCFLAVSSAVAQKTEIKKIEEIKKVETTTAQPAELKLQSKKAQVTLVPVEKKTELKKVDSSRRLEATKVQKEVVPQGNAKK